MQCGKLLPELLRIAARTQLQIFQHEKAVCTCGAVRDRLRYTDRLRYGNLVQPRCFGDEHRQMSGIVELEEIARAVRSLQAVSLVDAASADGGCVAHIERVMRRIAYGRAEVREKFGVHALKRRSPCSVNSNIGPQAISQ